MARRRFDDDVAAWRLQTLFLIGLAFFQQLFRFSNYSYPYQLIEPLTDFSRFAPPVILSIALAMGALMAVGQVRNQSNGGRALPFPASLGARRAIFVCPPLLWGISYAASTLGSPTPLVFVFGCATIVSQSLAVVVATFTWMALAKRIYETNPKATVVMISSGTALAFLLAALSQAVVGSDWLLGIVMTPMTGLLLALTTRAEADVPPSFGSSGSEAGISTSSRHDTILLVAVGTLFVIALSVSGSINSDLNPLASRRSDLRHLVTMASIVSFTLVLMVSRQIRAAVYLGVLFYTLIFLTGLVLTWVGLDATADLGKALCSAGGRCFESLLFVLFVVLFDERHPQRVTLFLLLPEALGIQISRLVLPFVFGTSGVTYEDYVTTLSIVLLLVCVVCVVALLAIEVLAQLAAHPASSPSPSSPDWRDKDTSNREKDRLDAVFGHYRLTAKESQVAYGVFHGHSVDRIASDLALSSNTVRTHMKSIYRKMNVHSRQELIQEVTSFTRGAEASDAAPPRPPAASPMRSSLP